MGRKKNNIVLLALVGALLVAVMASAGAGATPGHFCSNQSPVHQEMWKDVPGEVTFASGPHKVTNASLFLYNLGTKIGAWHSVTGIERIGQTHHWTGLVDFSVDRGDYWAYFLVNDMVGPCEFKMGTITVK